jgi:general secretion pathway protein I
MRRAHGGFSLLEILVAFVIMAMALGVIMRVFSGSLNNVEAARRHAQAVLIAESRLAALGVETPLTDGETHGELAGDYRWRSRVWRQADSGAATPEGASGPSLYQIEVSVDWPATPNKRGQVRLVSLRAGRAP